MAYGQNASSCDPLRNQEVQKYQTRAGWGMI